MATGDRLSDHNWLMELKDGARLLATLDFEESASGTEGGGVSRDPETGVKLRAGLPTRDAFDASRPWEQGRDAAVAQLLENEYWNKKVIDALFWELDPATGDPVTSNPTRKLRVMVRGVTWPKGSASSAEESMLKVNLEPQP